MVQLSIISDRNPLREVALARYPATVGRLPSDTVCLNEEGVWDRHIEITFDRKSGFHFAVNPAASLLVNGERAESGMLRNGDLLQLGAAQVRFWLTRTNQKSLRLREALTWTALGLLFVVQFVFIWALLQ